MMYSVSNINNSITNWLQSFSCDQYAEVFEKFGYVTLEKLSQINHAILVEMGISSLLDRHKIVENLQRLKNTQIAKKKTKAAMNSTQNAIPNVTFYNNRIYPNEIFREECANQVYIQENDTNNKKVAQKLANEILEYAKVENASSTYSCVTLSSLRKATPLESLQKLVNQAEVQTVDTKGEIFENKSIEIQKSSQKRSNKNTNEKKSKKLKQSQNKKEEEPLVVSYLPNEYNYYQNDGYYEQQYAYNQHESNLIVNDSNFIPMYQEQYYNYS